MAGLASLRPTSPFGALQPKLQDASCSAGSEARNAVATSAERVSQSLQKHSRALHFLGTFHTRQGAQIWKRNSGWHDLQGPGAEEVGTVKPAAKITEVKSKSLRRREWRRGPSTSRSPSLSCVSFPPLSASGQPTEDAKCMPAADRTGGPSMGLKSTSPAPGQIGARIRIFSLFAAALLLISTQTCLLPAVAHAAGSADSIAASHLGQKIATTLRASGFADEAIVFLMATLPIVELRGAIPVAYWMEMESVKASILAILGNALPVPLILLCVGPLVEQAARSTGWLKSSAAWFLENTRKKAGPIQEFKWLGLMLFVAVPLPGTGAWTGAFAAHILGMPFWSAFSANVVGVTMAGLLMNLLCKLGLKWALVVGFALFLASTFLWSFLRWVRGFSTQKIQE